MVFGLGENIQAVRKHYQESEHMAPVDGKTPFLAQLKTATASRHERLESLPILRNLLSDDYTLKEYGSLLEKFITIVRPLEAALLGSECMLANLYGYRPRSDDLLQDINYLSKSTSLPDIEIPNSIIITEAAEIGCLYVLEGSRFGGTVIARHVKKTLGLNSQKGLLFFTKGTQNINRDWLRLRILAETHCQSSSARAQAISSACLTFDLFHKGLSNEHSR